MKNYHTKLDAAILDCYIKLYKNAEPSADFEDLVKNATINERGQKEIDFNAYLIDEVVMENIILKTTRIHKLKSWEVMKFRNTILLGCSPRTKI